MRKMAAVPALILAFLLGVLAAFVVVLFTREAQVSAVRTPAGEVEVADSGFLETVAYHTGVTWRDGNTIEVLFDGNATFPRLWADLRSAERNITFQNFWMRQSETADTLASILAARARDGVSVHFIYDAYGSDLSDAYLGRLRDAGVQVRELRPIHPLALSKAQHRSHVRAIVIDGTVGYTGGFAIASNWRGDGDSPDEWRDTSVRLTGPVVNQLQSAFAAAWGEVAGVLLAGPAYFGGDRLPSASGAGAALLYSPATPGSTTAERLIALTINGARQKLYLTTAYFAPEDDLARMLRDAARRGVDVRVLTAGEHTDQPMVRRAGRHRYEALLEAGVRIYEYAPTMIHAKTFVVDGAWSGIGTINLDNRSLALNDEVMLITPDPRIAMTLENAFARDLARSHEIGLAEFADRSFLARLSERFAAVFTRIL